MKKSRIILITIIGLVITALGITMEVMEEGRVITSDRLPQPVKTYLNANYPGNTIAYAKKKKELFSTVYQVNMTNGFELEFNNEGMLTDFDD
ncbi:MAG: PepSY-like domain-containing protein [Prevotella sp.]|nr:PepSY-like domain-containing protein [Prevotella sp.]